MTQTHFIPPLNHNKPNYPAWTKYLILGLAIFFGLGILSSSFQLLKSIFLSGFQFANFIIFASNILASLFLFALLSLPALITRSSIKGKHQLNSALLKLSVDQLNTKEFGEPGGNLSYARFGKNAADGKEGETRTAKIIRENILNQYPAARLINCIAWPGTDSADIDHVLLIGNSIILLDSKLYQPGQYYWDGKRLFRNGTELEPFKIAAAAQAIKTIFPQQQVSAAIVIHSKTESDISIELGKVPSPFPPALTAHQLVEFVKSQVSHTDLNSVYWQTLQRILDLKN